MSKRLTPYQKMLRDAAERKRIVLELFALGWKQTKIARKVRLSDERVSQIVKPLKPSKTPKEPKSAA